MMLHFAYADFEEQLNKNEKVHEIYKQYLAIEGIDPTLVSDRLGQAHMNIGPINS